MNMVETMLIRRCADAEALGRAYAKLEARFPWLARYASDTISGCDDSGE